MWLEWHAYLMYWAKAYCNQNGLEDAQKVWMASDVPWFIPLREIIQFGHPSVSISKKIKILHRRIFFPVPKTKSRVLWNWREPANGHSFLQWRGPFRLSRPLGLMGFVGVASDVVWALHWFCLQFMDGRWMDYEDLAICSHLFLEHRDSGGSQFLAIPNISCYAADCEQLECLSTKRRRKLYSLKTRNSTAILAKFVRIKIDWYTNPSSKKWTLESWLQRWLSSIFTSCWSSMPLTATTTAGPAICKITATGAAADSDISRYC